MSEERRGHRDRPEERQSRAGSGARCPLRPLHASSVPSYHAVSSTSRRPQVTSRAAARRARRTPKAKAPAARAHEQRPTSSRRSPAALQAAGARSRRRCSADAVPGPPEGPVPTRAGRLWGRPAAPSRLIPHRGCWDELRAAREGQRLRAARTLVAQAQSARNRHVTG